MSEYMNLENLRAKLLSAERQTAPDEQVPYAFEKRIMAHLARKPAEDLFSLWGSALWKGAAACAVITALSVAFSVWSFHSATENDEDAFETVVLAGADQLTQTW